MGEVMPTRKEEEAATEKPKTLDADVFKAAGGGLDDLLKNADEQIAKDQSFETLFGAMADAAQYAETIQKLPEITKRYPELQLYSKRKLAAIRAFAEQSSQSKDSAPSLETTDFFHTLNRMEDELAARDMRTAMPNLEFQKMAALDMNINSRLNHWRAHPTEENKKWIAEGEEKLKTLDRGFEGFVLMTSDQPDKGTAYEKADYLNQQKKKIYRTQAREEQDGAYNQLRTLVETHHTNPEIHDRDIKTIQ